MLLYTTKKMAITVFISLAILVTTVRCQTAPTSADIATTVAELRQMVQDLQQQVAAVHTTLQTQQTMSIDEVCKALTSSLGGPSSVPAVPKDCKEVQKAGNTTSGVYTIQPTGEMSGHEVFCDMDTDGGGWTVIQRRFDGTQDFYKTYAEYEDGFGNATGEYYLGNRLIHEITSSGKYELRVELEDFQKTVKTEHYLEFSVGDSASKYQLHVAGPNGTAGDSLMFEHDGKKFSVPDADNDATNSVNCAQKHHGGYWYSSCFKSNVNGQWGVAGEKGDSLMFDHDGKKFSAPDADNDDTNSVNCAQKHHGGYWYSSCFKSNVNGQWGVAGEKGIVWGSFKDWNMYVLKRTVLAIRPVS